MSTRFQNDCPLNRFQHDCVEKAVYPDMGYNIIYPVLGLMGELGELYEKVAMPHPSLMMDELQDLVVLEMGDVAWYTAMMCYEADLNLGGVFDPIGYLSIRPPAGSITQCASVMNCIMSTTRFVEQLKKFIRRDQYKSGLRLEDDKMIEGIREMVKEVMSMIFYLSESIGTPVHLILAKNVAKINSRAERGVLEGSGDRR